MAPRTRKTGAKPLRGVPPAPPPAGVEVALRGSLDRAEVDGTLEGWCWSPDEPELRRPLSILVDGTEVARVLAERDRPDLRAAGIGDGRHGVLFALDPAVMVAGRTAAISLRDVRTGRQVGQTIGVRWPGTAAAAAALADDAEPTLHGHLDRVSRDGWVSGWCWYPELPDVHVELAILVDDERVGVTRANNFRPDLEQAGIGNGTHGFAYALPYSALADKGTLRVTVQDARSGRNLSDPIIVRLGRQAAAEDRILDLERQIRLLRGQLDEISRAGRGRDEDRATRELFATVAAFFTDLATGDARRDLGAAGLAGALDEVASRFAPITLAQPEQAAATLCIAATGPIEALYGCIAAAHDAGIDHRADIVLLDDGAAGAAPALLPTVVRNLRYLRLHDGAGLVAGRTEMAKAARGDIVAFLAPDVRLLPGWLDEILATFAREPQSVVVGGRLLREDGLLHHTCLVAGTDGSLRDIAHLAPADASEHRFLRRADAVAGFAFAVRRQALLATGGFSPLYSRFGHAVADLCARLRGPGGLVLYQPLAVATFIDRNAPANDADPPDLRLTDEETLRLRERLHHEGWPAGPGSGRFAGHVLVVDDDLPHPDRDAGSIVTFEQMQVLRQLGWRVTFCPVHAITLDVPAAEMLARLGVEVAGPPEYGSVTHYLQANGARLDLVHVYRYANVAMFLDRVRELAPDAKLVFAIADLHFLREQRRAELAAQPAPVAAREEELRCVREADATIVSSDYELTLLQREIPPEKLTLLRWITRPEPVRRGFAERSDLCFVGNFRHPPNVDGVQWFLANVFPRVRANLPGARLLLAGSDMPPALRDLSEPGVEVLGWVADLAGLFSRVRLSVAPLRFGAGFKGKVATSLAHGLPVVGSSISLEGTGLADGDGILVADDPAGFARAVLRLHQDEMLWQAQSARALERVAALYSPEAALEVWRRLLTRLERPTAP